MRGLYRRTAVLGAFLVMGSCVAGGAFAQQTTADSLQTSAPQSAAPLRVDRIALAHDYDPVAKEPVDVATVFPADVERVCCFTQILGAPKPTTITHVWYHEGKTMAKVNLPVRAATWRTYSSKKIWPTWTGTWEVKILDENGAVLATAEFVIEPAAAKAE